MSIEPYEYWPENPIPPGSVLVEMIAEGHVRRSELVDSLCLLPTEFQSLLNGDMRISNQMAESLEKITSYPAQCWLNLDRQFIAGKSKDSPC